ncbi:hypothetical protein P8605_02615 [Streptomyces sp. T-3]|nr:hypothetical protein [Streptomyces sp. T-3]
MLIQQLERAGVIVDLVPDPRAATTAAEMVALLRSLRRRADLSYRELERRAAKAGDALPRTTVSGVLSRDDLPRTEFLTAYLRACGLDRQTAQEWLDARNRLAAATEPSAISSPSATDSHPPVLDARESSGTSGPDEAATAAQSVHPAPPGASEAPTTVDRQAPPTPRPRRRILTTPVIAAATAALAAAAATTLWLAPRNDPGPSPAADSPSRTTAESTATQTSNNAPATPSPASDSPSPAVSTTPPATSPADQLPAAGPVAIQLISDTSQCLTEGVQRDGRSGREIAVQAPCSAIPQVSLERVGHDVYRIHWKHPTNGEGCLTIDGTEDGALLTPRNCTNSNQQQIRIEPYQEGHRLRPVSTDLCIGFLPPTTEGAEAIQTACTGSSKQVFRIGRQ